MFNGFVNDNVDAVECDWLTADVVSKSSSTRDSNAESLEELLKHSLVGGTVKLAGVELRGEVRELGDIVSVGF